MTDDINILLDLIDNLEVMLQQYSSITNLISATDAEEIDEINQLLDERETLISDIKLIEPQIIELITMQSNNRSAMILQMFGGGEVSSALSKEERVLQKKILNIRSLQSDILVMDENNERRLKEKYTEVKKALEDLQDDKKKLDFYSRVRFNTKGTKLNNLS